WAVNVSGYEPPVPAAGAPLSTPVSRSRPTPRGKVPVRPRVGVGKPVVVTVRAPVTPTRKPALFALVIAGARPRVPLSETGMPADVIPLSAASGLYCALRL